MELWVLIKPFHCANIPHRAGWLPESLQPVIRWAWYLWDGWMPWPEATALGSHWLWVDKYLLSSNNGRNGRELGNFGFSLGFHFFSFGGYRSGMLLISSYQIPPRKRQMTQMARIFPNAPSLPFPPETVQGCGDVVTLAGSSKPHVYEAYIPPSCCIWVLTEYRHRTAGREFPLPYPILWAHHQIPLVLVAKNFEIWP